MVTELEVAAPFRRPSESFALQHSDDAFEIVFVVAEVHCCPHTRIHEKSPRELG